MKNRFLSYMCTWIILFSAYAQDNIPIGTWRNHSAYNRGRLLEKVSNLIYCVTEHGLFVYDTEDNSLEILSKIDGLSDVTITAIRYNEIDQQLILGYDNGNIDLLNNDGIVNIRSLKNASVRTGKAVLDIEYDEENIYFLTEFGVVVFNKAQKGVKETWQNLGDMGQFLPLYQSEILRDTVFLATEAGVIAGPLNNSVNLLDYNNWYRYDEADGLPEVQSGSIQAISQDLYLVQQSSQLLIYNNGKWKEVTDIPDRTILSLSESEGSLLVTLEDAVLQIEPDGSHTLFQDVNMISPHYSLKDAASLLVADELNGLLRLTGNGSEIIFPNGPFTNQVGKIYNYGEYIVAVPGMTSDNQPGNNNEGFNVFDPGGWMNYNNSGNKTAIPIPEIKDLIDVIYNQVEKQLYFASFGYGILQWDLQNSFDILDENTPGVTLVNSAPPGRNTLVSSLAIDEQGTNWALNYNSGIPLHRFNLNTEWDGYTIPAPNAGYAKRMVILDNQDKWFLIDPAKGGGILVYNESSGLYRYLDESTDNGELPSSNVTDMILDREGQIWVTTDKGVAYFPFPYSALDGGKVEAVLPVFNLGFLFKNERTLCITVDGGSRKWIGTDQGAWLFNFDGSKLVEYFNVDNSPLLSNAVIDIEVNEITGEVFFATEKGIVSYRSDATEPSEKHASVKIFPNPVTPDFNGVVGISGLTEFATVKITDIAGKLVYETSSAGGTASWNVRDYSGKRAATGIYLVYSSNADGTDTFVGKIAVIN